jgi:diguanylate cyclase (GGDEF)-like protein
VPKRHAGHLRVVRDGEEPITFASQGRPRSTQRRRFDFPSLVVRLLMVAWGGAICAALLDEFQALPHLPFLVAMGMTGVLVVVTFFLTRDGVPNWRGDLVTERRAEPPEDQAKDLLTQLPTFNYFQRRVDEAFARARRMGKPFSLVLVDVNHLTAVNNEYGVAAGDEVLRHVARAVDGTRRYNDLVARLGGDEFGVVLADCGEQGVKAFIDRLEDRLSRESAAATVNGRVISLWAGICSGSATSDPSMLAPEAVLERAIENLNQAKHDRERRRRMWLSA